MSGGGGTREYSPQGARAGLSPSSSTTTPIPSSSHPPLLSLQPKIQGAAFRLSSIESATKFRFFFLLFFFFFYHSFFFFQPLSAAKELKTVRLSSAFIGEIYIFLYVSHKAVIRAAQGACVCPATSKVGDTEVWNTAGSRATQEMLGTWGVSATFPGSAGWSLHHLYTHTCICEQMTWHWRKTIKIMPLPLARPV